MHKKHSGNFKENRLVLRNENWSALRSFSATGPSLRTIAHNSVLPTKFQQKS